jgi:hypothetical protein
VGLRFAFHGEYPDDGPAIGQKLRLGEWKMHPIEKKAVVELLNKCWMTHDGMWFYHTFREVGIEKANQINKAAIRSLAPLEINRIKNFLGIEKEHLETFDEFKDFFSGASEWFIPDFMNATMSFPRKNVLHWEFKARECFAYKGMKRIGVIDEYECGVIYRLGCWIESLGITYDVSPDVKRCSMIDNPACSGDFTLHLRA